MIGGLIMTHGDDDGIILPPRVASAHAVLLPIYRSLEEKTDVMTYAESLAKELRGIRYHDAPLRVLIDDRETGGIRNWIWIKKGIPLRVEIGPRDISQNAVYLGRRDKRSSDKISIKRDAFVGSITQLLDEIQKNLFERALSYRNAHTITLDDRDGFYAFFTPKNADQPEIHGGFALSHWCGSQDCESKLKEDLGVTIRCVPFENAPQNGSCIGCGKSSSERVVFAKAY